jgi:uncharacterized membrane protein
LFNIHGVLKQAIPRAEFLLPNLPKLLLINSVGIYVNLNQKQAGPYEAVQINQMFTNGQVTLDTLGWMDGMANWEPLSSPSFHSLGIGTQILGKQVSQISLRSEEQTHKLGQTFESGTFAIGSAISEAFTFFKANMLGSISWLALTGVLGSTMIGALLIPLISVNLFACVKRFMDSGKKMDLGDLFDFSKAVEKIAGPIVLGFIIGVGFVFLIIPGLIFSMWWTFSPCVIAHQPNFSFTDAMKESRNAAKGNWIKMLLLFFLLGLLQILGALCLGVGLLVTIPVGHIALYCAYYQCKKSN